MTLSICQHQNRKKGPENKDNKNHQKKRADKTAERASKIQASETIKGLSRSPSSRRTCDTDPFPASCGTRSPRTGASSSNR